MCAGGISTAQRQRYEKFWEGGDVFLKKSVGFFGGLKCFLYVCIWKGGLSGGVGCGGGEVL